jgi:PAS domain S-box-containing protein
MISTQSDQDARIDRLRILAIVLPLSYVVAVVVFLALNPLPSWATTLVAIAVSAPLVAAFAVVVFAVIRTMQREVLRREQRIRELLDSAPDGIVIADAHGTIVMVNQQAERMFGYTADELVGEFVERLLPPDLRDRHRGHRDAYYARPSLRPMGVGLALVAACKDGTLLPVEISLSPTASDNETLVTAVVRDVSARRSMEEERERLLAQAETQRERERIAMDLHDGVIQSIYGVTLGLETAIDDVKERPAQVHEALETSIGRLEQVIRDIRSYIFDLRPARVDGDPRESLPVLVEEFRVNTLLPATLEIDAALPPLDGDRSAAVFHVAQEALNNVQKHARATSVGVSLRHRDGLLHLEVGDDGIGFDTRARPADSHRGLQNMDARARAAGGTLSVDSAPGVGTVVHFDLPESHEEAP